MNVLKNWLTAALALLFGVLYTAALLGWLKPLSDVALVTRLEPIIFMILGYYFGRMPVTQHERALADEIARQTKKAEALQLHSRRTEQEREALEEKLKNLKAILASAADLPSRDNSDGRKNTAGEPAAALRYAVATAVDVLNS